MKKVSVIVPVYNVEQYLRKCLDSLVNQTLDNLEVIVVNDGSPDNSQNIIDEYEKKYPSLVKGYKKENGGLSSARNEGLKYATGEYISFVDSDDYLELNALQLMYSKAKEKGYDFVACDLRYVYPNKNIVVSCNLNNDIENFDEIRKSMINIYPTACNKIYNKKIFEKIKFKTGVWYEDVEFTYRMYSIIDKIGVVKKPLYNYLQRENTITKIFNDKIFDYISNWDGIIKFYKENKKYSKYRLELEYCYVRYIYATMVKGMMNFKDKEKYNKGIEKAINSVKINFPKYRKNKYFYKNIKGIYLLLFNKMLSQILYNFKKIKD